MSAARPSRGATDLPSRPQLAQQVSALVGSAVTVRDISTGWPSRVLVRTNSGNERVALHVSQASPHARKEWEWRFQNPASSVPVSAPAASLPLLVGLDEVNGRPVLVVVDGRSRLGRTTRFSILFNKRISREAAVNGWSEQTSTSGERIFAMWPRLFPLVVELILAGVDIEVPLVAAATSAAGLLEDDSEEAGERARRTVSALVRDAKFSRRVKKAYEHRCAMCQIGLGLLAGAHILPVSAPGALDKVWNGIALCHNHHAAFDAHKIWIASDSSISLKPSFVEEANASVESARFVTQTRPKLWTPTDPRKRPKSEMLEQRYGYYAGQYDWAPAF
jgi:hypothetical protein